MPGFFPYSQVVGWVLSVLLALLFCASAGMKFVQPPPMMEAFGKFGYPLSVILPLGVVELLSALLFLLPRTALFGTILLTGYMGGTIATHLRIGELFIPQIVIGVLVWVAYVLRNPAVLRAGLGWPTPSAS